MQVIIELSLLKTGFISFNTAAEAEASIAGLNGIQIRSNQFLKTFEFVLI